MSYQQPPPGYPPQQQQGYGQPQQPQGYAQPPQPAYRVPGDGLALPPNMLVLGILLLIAGAFIHAMTGFFSNPFSSAVQYINAIANLALSIGELAVAGGLVVAGLKEKEQPNSVRVAALLAGGAVVIHAVLQASGGLFGDLMKMAMMGAVRGR